MLRSSRVQFWLAATSIALLGTMLLTMRTVYVEWHVPSFGFPLPAFGYSGVSSGEMWFALLPLAVDVGVALLLCAPAVAMVRRLAGPRALAAVALVAGGLALLKIAWLAALIAMGIVFPHLRSDIQEDWPVACHTAWLGPPQQHLDTDPCPPAPVEPGVDDARGRVAPARADGAGR